MTQALNPEDHLLITAPDRYYAEGEKILFVDLQHDQLERMLNALRGSPVKLAFHVFGHNDRDLRWLLDSGYQADKILIDMSHSTAADPIKGHMLAWDKTVYTGRKDLDSIFPGYIEDPLGHMLVWVGERSNKRN